MADNHYITDNTRLNRLYQAAKNLISQMDKLRLTDDLGHDFERNIAMIAFRKTLADVEAVCP